MTREDLFEAIGGIDEERLEQTERTYKQSHLWMRYAGLAAGICLIIVAAVAIPTTLRIKSKQMNAFLTMEDTENCAGDNMLDGGENAVWEESGVQGEGAAGEAESDTAAQEDSSKDVIKQDQVNSFLINNSDTSYADLNLEHVFYTSLTAEIRDKMGFPEDSELTQTELGDYLGIVYNCEDADMNGCRVYLLSRYPDDVTICVVDTGTGYKLYGDSQFWYGE